MDPIAIYPVSIPSAYQQYPIIRAPPPSSINFLWENERGAPAWPGFEIAIHTAARIARFRPHVRPWQLAHTIYAVCRCAITDGQRAPAER